MTGCQLELDTVSGEGCAPESPVVSRRESMMIELTKHVFCWYIAQWFTLHSQQNPSYLA